MLLWILIFTFLGSFVSLIGGVLLLLKENLVRKKTLNLVAFAAGAMLAAAFLDLLPEAIREEAEGTPIFGEYKGLLGVVLIGMVVFFFLERFLFWYHHHACPEGEECEAEVPTVPLLIIGDSLHNFLDGVTIAGAFLVNIPLGIITSLAVFFHEIPQEMGNFGVLLALGMKREKVLAVNILSALFALLGAIMAFFLLEQFEFLIPVLVAFAAGNFIYIASSDLIPQLHQAFEKEKVAGQTLSFLIGILVIFLTTQFIGGG